MGKALSASRETWRVLLWGSVSDVFLAIIKIVFGYIGHSHALIADGFHSFADLTIDFLVIFVSHYGKRAADDDHPYGHARFETLGTVILALILTIVGVSIVVDAGMNVFTHKSFEIPSAFILGIVIFSIVLKEGFYRWTMYVAKKQKSDLLRANAAHHRSDVASSLVVLAGVVGALLGVHFFDAIAAAIVGFLIIKMAADLLWLSVRELVDTGVIGARLKLIESIIYSVPGVLAIHQLRTRTMAGSIFVDVHVQVSRNLSVTEGHYISHAVYWNLLTQSDFVRDVTVHIDTEDEEDEIDLNRHLPNREEFLKKFWKVCNEHQLPFHASIKNISLHYIEGKLHVDIILPLSILSEVSAAEKIQHHYRDHLRREFSFLGEIKLFFSV